jgi:arginase
MKFIPHGGSAPNIGVEKGPSAVLDNSFLEILKKTNNCKTLDITFSDPESMPDEEYYSVVSKDTNMMAKKIQDEISQGSYSKLVTVGGDHSIALGSMLAVLRTHKDKRVGLIDFDSHGDIHLLKTSPSGNFHGMWLRPLLEDFDIPEIKSIVDVQLHPEQLLYIGNLLTEEEEENFIKKNEVIVLDGVWVEKNKDSMIRHIEEFCQKVDMLHVTFDIDVFKESIVSATGTPNPDGFDIPMIESCIAPIKASGKLFSLDVVEVNPDKTGAEQAIKLAQKIITDLI